MTHLMCGSTTRPAGRSHARVTCFALRLLIPTVAFVSLVPAVEAAGPGPTVREVVEFTRIIQPENLDPDVLRTQVSPDGTHAFIVTRRADVATDRNRFEILLLDVNAEHLASAQITAPRRLLAVDATQDDSYGLPFLSEVRWNGNRTLVLRARIHDNPAQVYKMDVESGQLTQLTFETRSIGAFAVSDDLSRVVYVIQLPNPPMAPGAHSVVVGNQSFWNVKFSQNDLRGQYRRFQYVSAVGGSKAPAHALGPPFPDSSGWEPAISISPDGRWALLPRYEPKRHAEWARQYPLVAALTNIVRPAGDFDPLGYYSTRTSYTARRMVAYRLSDGHEQAVVDAPDDAMNGLGQIRSDRIWFGAGRSVVVAGTHLPLEASQSSTHSHVIEYWPDTGKWTSIAELDGRLDGAYRVPGSQEGFVAVDGQRRRYFERQHDGGWKESTASTGSSGDLAEAGTTSRRTVWNLTIQQKLNEPPDVVATGPNGHVVRLTELNPQFSATTWGSMRPFSWTDAAGRQWNGGLMEANASDNHRSHALVIQTYGFSADHFYLDGANEYDGYTSGFAGRAFLREDILVLAMPLRSTTAWPPEARPRLGIFADGVRGAIETLVKQGIVDPALIGIMGWSATGEQVLNLVTFSDAPIRAATLLDGDANTLFSLAVTYGAADDIWSRKQRLNEGLPYGDKLERWTRYDPSLHTDCVRAAIRIETYGPWVLNNWDIYALLRQQYKPAEMVVIPGGTHSLSRPSERMISLQGNVDWYRFWLEDGERTEPFLTGEDVASLRQQYARWRQMEELKRADDARPHCTRAWSE